MEAEFRPRQEEVKSNVMYSRHVNVNIVTKRSHVESIHVMSGV